MWITSLWFGRPQEVSYHIISVPWACAVCICEMLLFTKYEFWNLICLVLPSPVLQPLFLRHRKLFSSFIFIVLQKFLTQRLPRTVSSFCCSYWNKVYWFYVQYAKVVTLLCSFYWSLMMLNSQCLNFACANTGSFRQTSSLCWRKGLATNAWAQQTLCMLGKWLRELAMLGSRD